MWDETPPVFAPAFEALVPAQVHLERPSPNHGARAAGARLRCVVLHATADHGREQAAEAWLCDPASRVSAHLHVRRDGTVVRLVPDDRVAWHAGTSQWRKHRNVNAVSLGWELANRNDGVELYTAAQYHAVARLAAHYARQGLALDAVVSHAEVALPAGRKRDPAGFDWGAFRRLATALLGGAGRGAA